MPSDQKKKRDLKKKEAAKKKQGQPKSTKKTEDSELSEVTVTSTNGYIKPSNGVKGKSTIICDCKFRNVIVY